MLSGSILSPLIFRHFYFEYRSDETDSTFALGDDEFITDFVFSAQETIDRFKLVGTSDELMDRRAQLAKGGPPQPT